MTAGFSEGLPEGCNVGLELKLGVPDGPNDDNPDGDPVTLGWMLRLSEGDAVAVGCSLEVGNSDPIEVGMLDDDEFGLLLALGLFVGPIVGSELGFVVGTADSVG